MSTFIHDGLPGSSFAERPQARRRAPNTIYVKISPSDNKDKHTTSSSEGKRGLGDWRNGESTLKNGVRTSRRLIFTSTLVLALVLALALLLFFSGSASSEPLALPENLHFASLALVETVGGGGGGGSAILEARGITPSSPSSCGTCRCAPAPRLGNL